MPFAAATTLESASAVNNVTESMTAVDEASVTGIASVDLARILAARTSELAEVALAPDALEAAPTPATTVGRTTRILGHDDNLSLEPPVVTRPTAWRGTRGTRATGRVTAQESRPLTFAAI
jgi:hypothetical protein